MRIYEALPIYALTRTELLLNTTQVRMSRVIVNTDRNHPKSSLILTGGAVTLC